VKISGGAPESGFYWNSADHNGVTGGCRSLLMYLARGDDLTLFLEKGATFSDVTSQLTSLTVFRLLLHDSPRTI